MSKNKEILPQLKQSDSHRKSEISAESGKCRLSQFIRNIPFRLRDIPYKLRKIQDLPDSQLNHWESGRQFVQKIEKKSSGPGLVSSNPGL